MNIFDTLDPQDADFDLDKSSSMYALPGRTLADIYNMSGFQTQHRQVFEKAINEVRMENHASITVYNEVIKKLESFRAGLMRQNTVVGTMLQMYSEKSDYGSNPLFRPGSKVNMDPSNQTIDPRFQITKFAMGGKEYVISLKDNAELANSVGYMKNLIKATIDIYKQSQDITNKDLQKLVWEHPEFGFLKITEIDSNNNGRLLSYEKATTEVQQKFDHIRNKLLKPLGDLHNLQHMTENFADGTSRRMSPQEMVMKYEQILADIYYAGYKEKFNSRGEVESYTKNEFHGFSKDLLQFLGGGEVSKEFVFGHSMPIVQILSALRRSQTKPFGSAPLDYGLGTAMMSRAITQEGIGKAVRGMLKNQKDLAGIHIAKSRLDNVLEIMQSYENRIR